MKYGTEVKIICQRGDHHENGCPYSGKTGRVHSVYPDGTIEVDLAGEVLEFESDELEATK